MVEVADDAEVEDTAAYYSILHSDRSVKMYLVVMEAAEEAWATWA